VLISKHEVIGRSDEELIKKDHIGSKCKKRHILALGVGSSALAGFATIASGERTEGEAAALSDRMARRVLKANPWQTIHTPTPHPEIFP